MKLSEFFHMLFTPLSERPEDRSKSWPDVLAYLEGPQHDKIIKLADAMQDKKRREHPGEENRMQ